MDDHYARHGSLIQSIIIPFRGVTNEVSLHNGRKADYNVGESGRKSGLSKKYGEASHTEDDLLGRNICFSTTNQGAFAICLGRSLYSPDVVQVKGQLSLGKPMDLKAESTSYPTFQNSLKWRLISESQP